MSYKHKAAKRLKPSGEDHMIMWHCRLDDVGIKCMEKLHKYGLVESLNFGTHDTCKPCLMRKMTRTPFNGIMECATDLWDHTYICMWTYERLHTQWSSLLRDLY